MGKRNLGEFKKDKNMRKVYIVTKDVSANLKKLKKLKSMGLIKITQVKIETQTAKIPNKILPTGVWKHTNWNDMIWGSKEDSGRFEKLKNILGKEHIEDAIQVSTHIREKYDYFVTEDHDILDKRLELEKTFPNLKIRNPDELEKELTN